MSVLGEESEEGAVRSGDLSRVSSSGGGSSGAVRRHAVEFGFRV